MGFHNNPRFSRHMFVFITFNLDARAVIEGCELAWEYFEGIVLFRF